MATTSSTKKRRTKDELASEICALILSSETMPKRGRCAKALGTNWKQVEEAFTRLVAEGGLSHDGLGNYEIADRATLERIQGPVTTAKSGKKKRTAGKGKSKERRSRRTKAQMQSDREKRLFDLLDDLLKGSPHHPVFREVWSRANRDDSEWRKELSDLRKRFDALLK